MDLPNFKNTIDWYYGIKTARLRVKIIGFLFLIVSVSFIWYLNEKSRKEQHVSQGGSIYVGPGSSIKAGDGGISGNGGSIAIKAGDSISK